MFVSHLGGDLINNVALNFWREHKDREEIRLSEVVLAIS